jgi:hypothetical protein
MRIKTLIPQLDWTIKIFSEEGDIGIFDIHPYLEYEAFGKLKEISEFMKIINGKYYIEWECGADLSADTIEANMKIKEG